MICFYFKVDFERREERGFLSQMMKKLDLEPRKRGEKEFCLKIKFKKEEI